MEWDSATSTRYALQCMSSFTFHALACPLSAPGVSPHSFCRLCYLAAQEPSCVWCAPEVWSLPTATVTQILLLAMPHAEYSGPERYVFRFDCFLSFFPCSAAHASRAAPGSTEFSTFNVVVSMSVTCFTCLVDNHLHSRVVPASHLLSRLVVGHTCKASLMSAKNPVCHFFPVSKKNL